MITRAITACLLAGTIFTSACTRFEPPAVIPPSAAFAYEVARTGCGESRFVGRSPVEAMSMTISFVGEATRHYDIGIAMAERALAGKHATVRQMLDDRLAVSGNLGIEAGFKSFNKLELQSKQAADLAARLARAGTSMSKETMESLELAVRMMHMGNHFQVNAAVGTMLIGSYFAEAHEHGGSEQLLQIFVREARNHGVESVMASTGRTPEGLVNMLGNFAGLYALGIAAEEITDFDPARAAGDDLGLKINAEIDRLEAGTQRAAAKMRASYPDEIKTEPTGELVRGLVFEAMQERGMPPVLMEISDFMLGTTCTGVFGEDHTQEAQEGPSPLDRFVQMGEEMLAQATAH